jgi:hypothetical protein
MATVVVDGRTTPDAWRANSDVLKMVTRSESSTKRKHGSKSASLQSTLTGSASGWI